MNMNKQQNKKKLVIATTSFIFIAAIAIMILAFGGNGNNNEINKAQSNGTDVTVSEAQKEAKVEPTIIESNVSEVESSVVVPSIDDNKNDENEKINTNEIQLTEIPEKPQPPEKPATAVDTDEPHDKPTDPTLTDPTKKPSETVEPVETTKPTEEKPSSGETNSKGETYVPGFGWVKDSGPNVGGTSDSDGDWNKQIGDMN